MFIFLKNKKHTNELSILITKNINKNINIFLIGNVGIGKTYFTKILIKTIIKKNIYIKSPTYNLIEIYNFKNKLINHIDFYRKNKKNLYINIKENIKKYYINIIEWGTPIIKNIKNKKIIYFFLFKKNNKRIIKIK